MLTIEVLKEKSKEIARDIKAASIPYGESDIATKIENSFSQLVRTTVEKYNAIQTRATTAEDKAGALEKKNTELEKMLQDVRALVEEGVALTKKTHEAVKSLRAA
jgi:hypothetical protein